MPVIESKFTFLQMKIKPFCPNSTQLCQTDFCTRDLDTVRTESGFRGQPDHLRHDRLSGTASRFRLSAERSCHLLGWTDTIRRTGG